MPSPKSSTSTSTYRELHIPASDLASFMQSIYSQRRVGTLTVSFGTGGVPCGMLIWKERVKVQAEVRVESTNPEQTAQEIKNRSKYAELAHYPA